MESFCKEHSAVTTRLKELEDNKQAVWSAIDKLRNRPPVWVTFLFMAMSGAIGYLAAALR